MRQLQIGGSATLVILSTTELKKLYKQSIRHIGSEPFVLEDKDGAPGLGIMVEDDFDHNGRAVPGEPRKTAVKGNSRKNRTKRPLEKTVNTP